MALPSQQTALAQASSLYSQQLGALNNVRQQAGNVSNVASGLYGTGSGLLSQYGDNFAGLINSMPGQSQMPLSDYVNAAGNDVASNFDRSRGIQGREMSRMGINPNSGRYAGLMANLSRQEAAQRAGAMTDARITGQRENFNRGMQASQLGLSVANMGIGAQQSAGGLYGAAGGLYGQAAGQYGQAANEAGQYAGQTSMLDQLQALFGGADGGTTPTAAQGTTPASQATQGTAAGGQQAPYYLNSGTGGTYAPAAQPGAGWTFDPIPNAPFNGVLAPTLSDTITQNGLINAGNPYGNPWY